MVAQATPATPQPKTTTKTRSSIILSIVATARNLRDEIESPKPCRMPAFRLKPKVPIVPIKRIFR